MISLATIHSKDCFLEFQLILNHLEGNLNAKNNKGERYKIIEAVVDDLIENNKRMRKHLLLRISESHQTLNKNYWVQYKKSCNILESYLVLSPQPSDEEVNEIFNI